jgi:hypothetical protein
LFRFPFLPSAPIWETTIQKGKMIERDFPKIKDVT